MNKYVIELRPDCKVVQQICESNGQVCIGARSIQYLEELTADYINEHYGDLQDTAYKKGLEDGKLLGQNESWECARKIVCDDSCGGMSMKELLAIFNRGSDAYILRDFTAQQAIEMLKAYEEKQKADDKIEVGDEVEVLNSGNKYLIAWFAGTSLCGFAHDGVTCRLQPSDVRKTGRHFDISKILEEMKE